MGMDRAEETEAWLEAEDGRLVNPRHIRSLRVCRADDCAFLRLKESTDSGFDEDDIVAPLPLRFRRLAGLSTADLTESICCPEWIPKYQVPYQF